MNNIKILLAGLTIASVPNFAQAYEIAPNPNPPGSTITVTTSDATYSGDLFLNSGILNIDLGGTLQFSGYDGSSLNNDGTINNAGTLLPWDLENSGIISNAGTLSAGVYVKNSGTLINSGLMSNGMSGLSNSGTVVNSGTMDGGNTLWNYASGTYINSTGSTLRLTGDSRILNDGIVINYGTLNHRGGLAGYSTNNGILTNFGTMNNQGFFQNTLHGTLDNLGILNNNRVLMNNGTLANYGTMNNASGAMFTGVDAGGGTYIQSAGQTINNGIMDQATFDFKGGSLSGSGTMNGNVNIGSLASVNPGNSPGTMTINGNFTSGGTLVFEIAGLDAGLFDVLDINGNASFTGGSIRFDFINGFNAIAGNYWDFLYADTINGWDTLAFTFNGLGDGLGWSFTQLDTGGERLMIASTVVSPVPELQTYVMLLAGLGLIGFMARRREDFND